MNGHPAASGDVRFAPYNGHPPDGSASLVRLPGCHWDAEVGIAAGPDGALWFTESGGNKTVALLADTIHNVGDAATAIPIAVAFWFARKNPSERFTFGYGRVEDLASVAIVLTARSAATKGRRRAR